MLLSCYGNALARLACVCTHIIDNSIGIVIDIILAVLKSSLVEEISRTGVIGAGAAQRRVKRVALTVIQRTRGPWDSIFDPWGVKLRAR